MGHFTPDLFQFLRQLKRNNDRDWFAKNKQRYIDDVQQPALDFVSDVGVGLRKISKNLVADPRPVGGSLFRIYRDVRFSKDKSPYKTHIGGYVALEGSGNGPSAVAPLYLHVGTTGRFVAAGHYMMDGPQLARFRAAVLDERSGGRLAAMLKTLGRAGFEPGSHDALKKVPRGMDPAHPRADLLKRKGLIVSFPEIPRDLLVRRELVDWLVKHTKRVVPLVEWLAALGE
jgi:uncharacterized protein (TIGR02453 family)